MQAGQFVMSKKAVQYLQEIDTNIAVLSVVGPYRTGKSFLLNRFAGSQSGFALGSTTNACTKGIWIWGQKVEDNLTIILVDTEGINSFDRDENTDARLLVLACIMSSAILYNIMGVIDERTLEALSFTTNLSKHIQGKDQFITQYLPDLKFVIRDFSLDLNDRDPSSYLENCLKLLQGDSEDIVQKNNVRVAIQKYFKNRSCHCLVRPVDQEDQLRNIEQILYDNLRKPFRLQVEELITNTLATIKPKVYKGVALNGSRLVTLLSSVVQMMNSSEIPNIESSLDRLIDKEQKRLINQVTSLLSPQLPMANEELHLSIIDSISKGLKIIKAYMLPDDKKLEVIYQFHALIEEQGRSLWQDNSLKGRKINQVISNKMLDIMIEQSQSSTYQLSALLSQVDQMKKVYYNVYQIYMQESKQPTQFEVYSQFLEQALHVIEKVNHSQQLNWQNQLDKETKQLYILKGQYQTTSELLQKEKSRATQQIEELKSTLEQERKDYEWKLAELREGKQIDILNDPEAYLIKEYKEQKKIETTNTNLILDDIRKQVELISSRQDEIITQRNQLEIDNITLKIQTKVKAESELVIENLKNYYKNEIETLKLTIRQLEGLVSQAREEIVKKDAEVAIYKQKIKNQEKLKTRDIQHADMMCKISDQLIKLLKKN